MNVIRKLEIFLKIDFILSDIRLQYSRRKTLYLVLDKLTHDTLLFFKMSPTEGSTKELSSHENCFNPFFRCRKKLSVRTTKMNLNPSNNSSSCFRYPPQTGSSSSELKDAVSCPQSNPFVILVYHFDRRMTMMTNVNLCSQC